MGDWVRREDGWFRDRVTTGPHRIDLRLVMNRNEPLRVLFVFEPDDMPGWQITLEHQLIDGAVTLVESRAVRIDASADPTPLYRNAGGRSLEQQLARELRQDMIRRNLPADWQQAALLKRRSGRRPVTDLELAEVAQGYVDAWETDRRRPMVLLAEREHRAVDTLQGLLRTAVNRGIFVREGHGRPGGALTDKGRALLAAKEASDGKH